MTLEEIMAELRRAEFVSTIKALQEAIDRETEALFREVYASRLPSKKAAWAHAKETAETFYAEDITECRTLSAPLRPDVVLFYRRKAVAWAVAGQLDRIERATILGHCAREGAR